MTPFPTDPVRAVGPMRLVLTTYPSPEAAQRAVGSVLERRLAACASVLSVASRYWWRDHLESADESLVLFKTVPKRVGALLDFLQRSHPYRTPEIVEVDVPRANDGYLAYLSATLGPSPVSRGARSATRRAARRDPGARGPARTRARPRHRST